MENSTLLSQCQVIPGTHKGSNVIWLRFNFNPDLVKAAKAIKAKWSQSQKCWYLPDNHHFREMFALPEKYVGRSVFAKISPVNIPALTELKNQLQLKSYSPSTIRTYLIEFAQLLYLLKNVPVQSLTYERLRAYFLYCINEQKISDNQLHSRINAIKFYFEQVLKMDRFYAEIPRPKKPSIVPKALSHQDVKKLFRVVSNSKHLLMLKLCYGMGLRVSEVVNLKITDIDSGRMQVLIEAAKGKKDRYVNLPHAILEALRTYYKAYRPKKYLFEGQYGDRYATRSVQAVFKAALIKAKINKAIGIHGLRHSYATHLLEFGTDISFIQKLMGHNDLKTTLRYTHVSQATIGNIISPLDRL